MYHPSKYDAHNKALENMIIKFNDTAKIVGNELKMYSQVKENYRDDGGIEYLATGQKVLYDFEKRHNYYNGCGGLAFKTLGQFERKILKQEIKLSIQCSTDENCFIIAWHEDYKKEDKKYINSATQDGRGERNAKRFTEDFIEIKYSDMGIFYNILLNAFKEKSFNKKSFL